VKLAQTRFERIRVKIFSPASGLSFPGCITVHLGMIGTVHALPISWANTGETHPRESRVRAQGRNGLFQATKARLEVMQEGGGPTRLQAVCPDDL